MYTEEKIEEFKKEFPEVVSANLANICLWLESDIGLKEADILNMMRRVEGFIYYKALSAIARDL